MSSDPDVNPPPSGAARDVVLVEHNLRSPLGHFLQYVASACEGAEAAGDQFRAVGHRQMEPEVRERTGAIPHFDFRFSGAYPPWFRYLRRCFGLGQQLWFRSVRQAFLADLSRLSGSLDWSADSRFFFSTLLPAEALAVVSWLESLPSDERPMVGLMLRYPVHRPYLGVRSSTAVHRKLFRWIDCSPARARLRCFSDSELLVRQFERCGGHDIHMLPIPHTPAPPSEPSESTAPTFCYMGRAAVEKGYALLPGIFAPFREELAAGKIRLTVQAAEPGTEPGVLADAGRELAGLGVQFLGDVLSSDEYRRAMVEADVVVLPYVRAENCYAGTSGIFAEAVALGKPVIATDGTWMADELTRCGAGVAASSGDVPGFSRAVRTCLDTLPELRRKAANDAALWRQRHCPSSFHQALMAGFE